MHDLSKFTPLQLAQVYLTEARLVHSEMPSPATKRLVERAQAKYEAVAKGPNDPK